MKKISKQLLSVILALCLSASVITAASLNVSAATADEPSGVLTSGDYQYEVVNKTLARIKKYIGSNAKEIKIPATINGCTVKYIGSSAFEGCSAERLIIPYTVTYIGSRAFYNATFKYFVVGKNVTTVDTNGLSCSCMRVFIPKTATLNKTAFDNYPLTDIYFEGTEAEWKDFTTTSRSYAGQIIHYDCDLTVCYGISKVVSDDFTLNLRSDNGGSLYTGEIPLKAGTYELKVEREDAFNALKGNNVYGYNKTVNDSSAGGMTMRANYKSPVRLIASGGIYKFSFNHDTGVFTVKRTGELPYIYTIGDVKFVFRQIPGTDYYYASGHVYKAPDSSNLCKICKDGVILGAKGAQNIGNLMGINPVQLSSESDNVLYGSISGVSESWGLVFNAKTNTITGVNSAKVTNYINKVWLSSFGKHQLRLELSDNNGADNIATATKELSAGIYQFNVYNDDKFYGGDFYIKDSGGNTLKSSYKSLVTFNATGGTYTFSFNKTTGALAVKKIK